MGNVRDEAGLENVIGVIFWPIHYYITHTRAVSGSKDATTVVLSQLLVDVCVGKLSIHLMKPESRVFRPERWHFQRNCMNNWGWNFICGCGKGEVGQEQT